ncbi:MAG: glycosyltransferase [Sandaracinaceae bacterium]|nr:glycosyltransferase [Sandaracinaceae bacterium]
MYVIPIGVPLFRDGPQVSIQTDWRRAVELLRDSLGGRYGDLVLLSPWLPVDAEEAKEQRLEPLEGVASVRAQTLYDARVRARHFWSREARPLRATLADALRTAEVVHSGLDELHRPLTGMAFAMASRRGVPTVFVQDTDVVVQVPQLARPGRVPRARARVYTAAFEPLCRWCVRRADLTLLKSGTLERRYAPHAKNLLVFEDTSYFSHEIVDRAEVERRLATLGEDRPLRFVYCGRLVARKGVDVSLRILARARARGARVELEVIGSGPEEQRLAALAASLGIADAVRLTGTATYGPALLRRLAAFDGLLFTPTAEDTPRMIFDGYAAGLPLVASPIPYVEERARAERATALLPDDVLEAADALAALDRDRARLGELARRACDAAAYHAADAWYARRAERTHEAVDRARRARGGRS